MEAISSTYASSPDRSGYAARLMRESGVGVVNSGAGRPTWGYSEQSGRQLGVQQSVSGAAEFTPYSPSLQKSGGDVAVTAKDGKESRSGSSEKSSTSAPLATAGGSDQEQDAQVQAEIARLKSIEAKVKAHEAAHKSAGGTMTGPVSYTYTRGPDGRSYVTGGEVPIEVSPGKTPQETISRMQQVIRAALAPADPSPQDRAVAAQASTQQQQARQEAAAAAATGTEESSTAADASSGTSPESSSTISSPAMPGTSSKTPAAAEVFQPLSFYA
ncbi:MAG: hypothetical protein A2X82_15985 [Geobacteraceae bacterium GWC2_55_20]|nr:MAG: hypothetical protein A2X82_15985 [Geobacteraceae bacterium GWC2_55_20]OGU21506.1 MAG: hypothetical protein A2X85_05200 [Geobacteraceae bacterium GWF2_54_21]